MGVSALAPRGVRRGRLDHPTRRDAGWGPRGGAAPAAVRLENTPGSRGLPGDPAEMGVEWLACHRSPAYFLDRYGQIYDATARAWLPFHLWPAQRHVVRTLQSHRLVVILKARQLGLSWLAVGYGLWLMLFRPAATVLFFSKRDDEAVQLLANRLWGMHRRLPAWLQAGAVVKESAHEWRLSNGSTALAFPTTGGRSYTATLAVVDEADFAPDLESRHPP